jgi:hypothetical protein
VSILARIVAIAVVALTASPALAAGGRPQGAPSAAHSPSAPRREACAEHGVQKALCTRCNPKLAPVYKAKGDWCPEHDRPESQCVLCHPELAKKGVK